MKKTVCSTLAVAFLFAGVNVAQATSSPTSGTKHYSLSCKGANGVTYTGGVDVKQTIAQNGVEFRDDRVAWSTSPSVHADKLQFRAYYGDGVAPDVVQIHNIGGTISSTNDVAYSNSGTAWNTSYKGSLYVNGDVRIALYVWDNGGTSSYCHGSKPAI